MTDKEQAKEADKVLDGKPSEEAKDESKKTPDSGEDVKQSDSGDPSFDVQARKMGWTPKDEFQGDPDKWVDARVWIDRAPAYDEIRKLKRKSKALESTVNELKNHYTRVEENAYKRALDSLKAEKLKALEEGDHKRVVEVDDELDRLRDSPPTAIAEPKVDPKFSQWVEDNPWYENNMDMREYADFVGVRYAKDYPHKTSEEVYKYALRRVQQEYPDKFKNPQRSAPPSVEGGKSAPGKSGKPRWSEMPEHFQRAGDKFVRQGVMTREQYMDDLIKIGELKA